LEQSPNIIYTGSAPNQQAIPAVRWAMDKFGKRMYLIGSDYVFPRTANLIIKEFGKLNNVSIVGEAYLPLGTRDVKKAVDAIASLAPDVVINTINGDTNHAFFEELSRRGIKAETTPILSLSLAEMEISRNPNIFAGHYTAWCYFQSLDTTGNREFANAFHLRFGKERMIDDPMEASHIGVHLWAQAVKEAGDLDLEKMWKLVLRQSLNAPQGIVSVDKETNHLWRTPRIGRALANGQFEVVWSSPHTIRPTPFPKFHTKPEWLDLLAKELRPR
jgi:urea transport system substrate-binding protein